MKLQDHVSVYITLRFILVFMYMAGFYWKPTNNYLVDSTGSFQLWKLKELLVNCHLESWRILGGYGFRDSAFRMKTANISRWLYLISGDDDRLFAKQCLSCCISSGGIYPEVKIVGKNELLVDEWWDIEWINLKKITHQRICISIHVDRLLATHQ